jgi:uncharacterized protein YoxC
MDTPMIFLFIVLAVALIAMHIAILRWVYKIDERLDEAKKTNDLLQQLLDKP